MSNYTIDTKFFSIGGNNPCYIIAEIGSNHNNNFDIACEMIEKAKEAGVNAVKFQTFRAAEHYSKKTPKINLYQEDIYSIIEKIEIDRSWHGKLSRLCDSLAIDFLDSPCDPEAIAIAVSVDMPVIKIASYDMVDVRLVEKIAATGKGVMFSTGMSNLGEIQTAINICHAQNNHKIIVLQCTSLYPAPVHLTNLKAIRTMAESFGVITGYSDHTLGDHIPCASVMMGAKVIEKHYTLDRTMPGPDHNFAIQPQELKEMIQKIREIESAIGDGIKNGPREEEMELFQKARRSISARRDIKKGEVLREEDIIIKRPGFGISPSQIGLVIGRTAKEDIGQDEPIGWEKI
jgi:sialic acid synthase SpsE